MPKENKSQFITKLARIFTFIGGISVIIFLGHIILFNFVFPSFPKDESDPMLFKFIFSNIKDIVLINLSLSVVIYITGLGLKKRKSWSRYISIILMIIGILWSMFAIYYTNFLFPIMMEELGTNQSSYFVFVNKIFSIVISVAIIGLFAWTIKKLMSDQIKSEFYKTS